MPHGLDFKYRNARDAKELYGIFKLRKDILVGEFGRIDINDVFDGYDAGAANFYASNGEGEPVGAVRIITDRDLESIYPQFINERKFSMEKNVDISKYRNGSKRPEEVSRLVVHPDYRGKRITPGLFACVYKHGKEEDVTDLFIIANCEMKPGIIEIPKLYEKLGFKKMNGYDIVPKYYDSFDVFSAPMHANASAAAKRAEIMSKIIEKGLIRDLKGSPHFDEMSSREKELCTNLLKIVEYRKLSPNERSSIFREASEWFVDDIKRNGEWKKEINNQKERGENINP